MSNMFRGDNPFFEFLSKLGDLMLVSVLWFVFCIPVVTIGPSTAALYYTVNKAVRCGEGYVWKNFWHSFKTNAKQGIAIWLIMLAVGLLIAFDAFFMRETKAEGKVATVLTIFYYVVLVAEAMLACYIFPYLARFSDTVKQTFKNAALMAVAYFPRTLLCLVIFVASALLIRIIPILLFVVPGVAMYLLNRVLEKVFYQQMSEEQKEEEDRKREMNF